MKIIEKILDKFKLQSTRKMENTPDILVSDTQTRKNSEKETDNKKYDTSKYNHDDYYARIAKQKENNLHITYEDVECYDLRPFDLNKPFISDGHFTTIELEKDNLNKAYYYLQKIHDVLSPFRHLYENVIFPNKIGTDYGTWSSENHLPISHLRLTPYTATMKNNKYPFWLWLSHCNDYGAEYIYMIYFNQDGEIGKADLIFHGSNGARLSYESKIRRNKNGLYVMQINKTLYVKPYGTKIIYHYKNNLSQKENEQSATKPKKEQKKKPYMREYDIKHYAVMCNSYMEHEEEMKQYEEG